MIKKKEDRFRFLNSENNKSKLFIILGIIIGILFISQIFNESSIIGKTVFDMWAALSVSISVSNSSASQTSEADSNGTVEFTDPKVMAVIEKIANLPSGVSVNATSYNQTLPSEWTAPSSSLVETTFQYFEINVNESVEGSFTIFFNLTRSELGSTSMNNIRLYRFTSDWNELTTAVEDSAGDPIKFSAVTNGFSRFAAGERASAATPTGGAVSGATGGAGGGEKPVFEIDQDLIKVFVKKGSSLRKSISIKNTGDTELNVLIDLQNLKNILSLSENLLKLKPREERIVDLNILTGAGVAPGVYVGNILVKAGDLLRIIKAIIEIESEKVLFDVSLDIPLDYKTVNPGDEVRVQSTLLNLGGLQNVDVLIEYSIKNSKGDIVLKEEETVKVGIQASFTKKFKLPDDLPLGKYVVSAVVKFEDSVGISSETFNVGGKERIEGFGAGSVIILIIILIAIAAAVVLERKGLKKIEKRLIKKPERKSTLKPEERKKLLEELRELNVSYNAGYITKDVFEKSKKKIEELLNK